MPKIAPHIILLPVLYKFGDGMPPGPAEPGPPETIINIPPISTTSPAKGVATVKTINLKTLKANSFKSDNWQGTKGLRPQGTNSAFAVAEIKSRRASDNKNVKKTFFIPK